MSQIIKYRLVNVNGGFSETLSLNEAQTHGNYEVVVEEIIETRIVPSEVALWQLRHVLEVMQLEHLVSAAIENLQEPVRGAAIKLWNFGNSVERYSPTVSLIKQVLNIDDNEADNIFMEADKIKL